MRSTALMIYAIVAYALFAAVVAIAIVFLAGPAGSTAPRHGWPGALLVDVALLGLFAVQHSVMARAGFKRRIAAYVPASAERATYVATASLVLGLLFWQWRPLPGMIWQVSAPPATALIWIVYATGWLIAISATFMVDHLDFTGIKQARSRGAYVSPPFTQRLLYTWIRHPMMLGLLIAFWATPRMSTGHLLFAAAGTAYIAVGVRFEERDLRRQLGSAYDEYARRVPAVVPGTRRGASTRGQLAELGCAESSDWVQPDASTGSVPK
jgi:protein-S-isoprenylcysteine O-methyltransferase Ste14